jgi:hypothetical protein
MMKIISTEFYLIEYQAGELGCPVFLAGDENADWEWDIYDPYPWKYTITKSYEFRSTDDDLRELELDYAGSPCSFVSEEFLKVCDTLGAAYRSVPVTVYMADGSKARKKYYYFLSAQWASLVDDQESTYAIERNLAGDSAEHKYYGGIKNYAWISNLVVKKDIDLDFFWCAEFMRHTCSKRFVEMAMIASLKGLKFIPLNSYFKYDPWGDLA